MSTIINTGWLKDNNGEKIAPKTLTSQVQTSDGTPLEDKIQADIKNNNVYINLIIDENGNVSADKTYAELLAAYNDGKVLYVKPTNDEGGGFVIPLQMWDDVGFVFSVMVSPKAVVYVYINSDDTVTLDDAAISAGADLSEILTENGIIKQSVLPEGYPYPVNIRTYVYPETEYSDPDGEGIMLESPIGLVAGETYVITLNGVDYTDTAKARTMEGATAITLGDVATYTTPYMVIDLLPEYVEMFGIGAMIVCMDGITEGTVSIGQDNIQKIDSKYLPQIDYSAKPGEDGYIRNKTHWVDYSGMLLDRESITVMDEESGIGGLITSVDIIEGNEYTVEWDVSSIDPDLGVLSGSAIASKVMDDTGENEMGIGVTLSIEGAGIFSIISLYPEYSAEFGMHTGFITDLGLAPNTYITLRSNSEVVHKLSKIYMPNEVLQYSTISLPSIVGWASVCYGDNKYVAVSEDTGTGAFSIDGVTWRSITMPVDDDPTTGYDSICYGDGKFVAIRSFTSEYAAYSTDGITWTQCTLPFKTNWLSVCYGNGKFVIVSLSNRALYSTDGITWEESTLPSSSYWNSVCYGNGKFVVISDDRNSDNKAVYSSDGITWEESTLPSTADWQSVCYGNGKFVAVAYDSNIVAYSSDGITWEESTLPSDVNWRSVCYGNDKFVAVAYDSNIVAYSSDGITWEESTLPSTADWRSVCYGNGKFVAVSGYDIKVAQSYDGINWTDKAVCTSDGLDASSILADAIGNANFDKILDENGIIKQSVLPNGYPYEGEGLVELLPMISYDIDAAGGDDLMLPNSIGLVIGETYTVNWNGVDYTCEAIAYNESGIDLAFLGNTGFINESDNGIPFIILDIPAAYVPLVGFGAGIMTADGSTVFEISISHIGTVVTKIDPKYTYQPDMNAKPGEGGHILNRTHWIETINDGILLDKTSLDINDSIAPIFTRIDIIAGNEYTIEWDLGDVNGMILGGSAIASEFIYNDMSIGVAVVVDSDLVGPFGICSLYPEYAEMYGVPTLFGILEASDLSIPGTFITLKTDADEVVHKLDKKFMPNEAFLYNDIGVEVKLPSTANWCSVCYGNGKFVAVASSNNNKVAYSSDGITWEESTLPSKANWQSICYGDGKFVAVDNNGNKVAYSSDGIAWEESTLLSSTRWNSVCYGDGKFVAVDNNSNKVAYSSDGIAWEESTLPSSAYWYSVCYGDGKFVAVTSNSNKVAYSSDGITWEESTLPSAASWKSVCYGNGKFVAVAYNSNIVAYSSDGITWEESTLPSSAYRQSVCYGNGKFVAVAISSNIVAYSSDGITWTESTLPSGAGWNSVCYGDGKFVAVATSTDSIAGSTDGIRWTHGFPVHTVATEDAQLLADAVSPYLNLQGGGEDIESMLATLLTPISNDEIDAICVIPAKSNL